MKKREKVGEQRKVKMKRKKRRCEKIRDWESMGREGKERREGECKKERRRGKKRGRECRGFDFLGWCLMMGWEKGNEISGPESHVVNQKRILPTSV